MKPTHRWRSRCRWRQTKVQSAQWSKPVTKGGLANTSSNSTSDAEEFEVIRLRTPSRSTAFGEIARTHANHTWLTGLKKGQRIRRQSAFRQQATIRIDLTRPENHW